VEADSIDFDVAAGSKETDLLGKAAESAHRQAQADVAELVFLRGEGAWSVSPSPWPVIRQEFSIPENARRPCKDRPWLPFGDCSKDTGSGPQWRLSFPRSTWEREPENRPVSLLESPELGSFSGQSSAIMS
jgi:hypothetical protein